MRLNELLAAYPTSNIVELVNPYKRTVRYVREDEYGSHYLEPPSDMLIKMRMKGYKPIYRRKMGRAIA